MAHLYSTATASGPNYTGALVVKPDSSTTAIAVGLPDGLQSLNRRAVMNRYKNRLYISGQFSRLLVYNEYGRAVKGGIYAPQSAPTLAAGSGSTGDTGEEWVGYLTFRHKRGTKILQESSPSAPSNLFVSTGTGRTWTNIPAVPFDDRVTHVVGYLSSDGSIPAECWERSIGVTTVTEARSTGSLGITLPVKVGLDNAVELDPHARDVPPYTFFNEMYHDVMWYFGDPDHPERIYYSKRYEPESVNSTSFFVLGQEVKPWLETLDGEPVVGGKRQGDELIIGTPTSFYAIQGYGQGDFSIRKINNYFGLLNHFSLAHCGPAADLWMATQEGVVYYDGQFHHVMLHLREFWRDDYAAHKANYENCFGAEDRFFMGYKLLIPQDDNTSFYYYAHYEPTQRGEQPWWTTDRRNRKDSVFGLLKSSFDDTRQDLYTGSCDGIVRQENVASNDDDDGDTFQKKFDVTFPHRFMGDQSGDDAHAHTFTDLNLFMKNENNAVTYSVYGGDDTARLSSRPQEKQTIPAAAVTLPRPLVPRTALHTPVMEVSGQGETLRLEVLKAKDLEVRGYSINWREGSQEQLPL